MIPGEQTAANVQTHTHAARIQFDRLPQTKAFRIQEFCGSARGTCISTPIQSSFLAGERVFAPAPVCTPTAPLFCSAHGSAALPKRRLKTEFMHATSELLSGAKDAQSHPHQREIPETTSRGGDPSSNVGLEDGGFWGPNPESCVIYVLCVVIQQYLCASSSHGRSV